MMANRRMEVLMNHLVVSDNGCSASSPSSFSEPREFVSTLQHLSPELRVKLLEEIGSGRWSGWICPDQEHRIHDPQNDADIQRLFGFNKPPEGSEPLFRFCAILPTNFNFLHYGTCFSEQSLVNQLWPEFCGALALACFDHCETAADEDSEDLTIYKPVWYEIWNILYERICKRAGRKIPKVRVQHSAYSEEILQHIRLMDMIEATWLIDPTSGEDGPIYIGVEMINGAVLSDIEK
jgi:hypothetical protein